MKSIYKLVWTEEAIDGLSDIITYLENNFSEKEIKKFVKLFNKRIEILKTKPKSFPISLSSNTVRRIVIDKLTSVYYLIEEDSVILVTIFDNRKNPKDLKI